MIYICDSSHCTDFQPSGSAARVRCISEPNPCKAPTRLSHHPMISSAAGLVCRRIARRCVGIFLQGGACPGVAAVFDKVVRVPVLPPVFGRCCPGVAGVGGGACPGVRCSQMLSCPGVRPCCPPMLPTALSAYSGRQPGLCQRYPRASSRLRLRHRSRSSFTASAACTLIGFTDSICSVSPYCTGSTSRA